MILFFILYNIQKIITKVFG